MADGSDTNDLVPLSDQTVAGLPSSVLRPNYDRSALTPGIVHIGLGNFHRAHQAWYLHRLMQQGKALDWAIIGAGVKPADTAQRQRLMSQDFLTSLIELDPKGKTAEVTGPMIGFVPVEPENAALIRQMADPRIRIVSLTVTDGGYFQEAATGGFDASHPDVLHDAQHPEQPHTAFGAIIAALRLRRANGIAPFTCLCCDNLQGNGSVLSQTVVSLARLSDPELAAWIEQECAFPNSMVDCIVPATGPNEITLARSFGIADQCPVTHEAFRQWVIEDNFSMGRPPFEDVGVTLSDRVHDYESMKIRMLNGGHQVIAGPGDLLGLETISQTMEHPLIRKTLRKVVTEEIVPHVAATPDMTPDAYLDLIERRFSNAEIADTTRRVAFDGSSRQPGFIVPSVQDGLTSDCSTTGLALVSALWSRYCEGVREDGSQIEPNDPDWDQLQKAAFAARTDPKAWLGIRHLYCDLGQNEHFCADFAKWRKMLILVGVEATLRAYVEQKL